MTVPVVALTHLGGKDDMPVLLVGPSLGISVATLWCDVACELTGSYQVVGWDLPGHGASPTGAAGFSIADLAQGLLDAVDSSLGRTELYYSGVSVAGAVGLQLLLDHSDRVCLAMLLCTGARIGEPARWQERACRVRSDGMSAVVKQSEERWFAPEFVKKNPAVARRRIADLQSVDVESYAQACQALSEFDVRARLPQITAPVVAVAGGHDVATPPGSLRLIAAQVQQGTYLEMPNCAHLPPVEDPHAVAQTLMHPLIGER